MATTARPHYTEGTREYDALGYSPDDHRWLVTEPELDSLTARLGHRPRTHTTPGGIWLLIGPDDTDVRDAHAALTSGDGTGQP